MKQRPTILRINLKIIYMLKLMKNCEMNLSSNRTGFLRNLVYTISVKVLTVFSGITLIFLKEELK